MEGDTVGKALLAFGAGTAGALVLWWLWNAETRKENVKPDLSTFQKPVAKVEKQWVYPVKSCKGVELSTAHCGIRGLKHDRCDMYKGNMEQRGVIECMKWGIANLPQ